MIMRIDGFVGRVWGLMERRVHNGSNTGYSNYLDGAISLARFAHFVIVVERHGRTSLLERGKQDAETRRESSDSSYLLLTSSLLNLCCL